LRLLSLQLFEKSEGVGLFVLVLVDQEVELLGLGLERGEFGLD